MSRVVFLEDRCKGCKLCAEVCPVHILHPSGRFNRQGYEVMEMRGACTGCASCAVICPDTAVRVFKSLTAKAGESQGSESQAGPSQAASVGGTPKAASIVGAQAGPKTETGPQGGAA